MGIPLTEAGYAKAGHFWDSDLEESPDLRWPLNIAVYDRMRRQDPQIRSVIRAVTMPILGATWAIDGKGVPDEVTAGVAENLDLPVKGAAEATVPARLRGRFSWPTHLRHALLMLVHGHCVDQETEALTQRGWVSGADLLPGDMLLTLNPETGLSEWQPCEQVHRYDGEHVMRRLDTRSHSSVTTLNHRWITRAHDTRKLRFRTTAELNTNDRIIRAAPSSDLPLEQKWSDALVELVAWYWTEGQEHPNGQALLWQSEAVNADKSARIRAALTSLFGPAKESLRNGTGPSIMGWRETSRIGGVSQRQVTCYFLSKAASEELRSIAPKKVVDPGFIASLTKAQLTLFVEASIAADGHRIAKNHVVLAQKDPARLDAFEMALSLLGRPWTRKQTKAGMWATCVGHAQAEIRPVHSAHRAGNDSSTDGICTVTDGVWCPQVQNRTWYARRRGTAYFTGNSFFEQVYRLDNDGLYSLRKLGWRPPRTISKVEVAPDGGLVAIEQVPAGAGRGARMPVANLVAYANEREGGDWLGSSLLRSAYKPWILKDRAMITQSRTLERNGLGVPVYGAGPLPDGMSGEAAQQHQRDELKAGKEVAQKLRGGENAGAAVPHGASLTMQGVTGDLPDADPVIRYYDEQIARGVLAHFLNLGTETGSWALGKTFADFFTLSLIAVAEEIASVTTQHVVEDLVDINWGPDVPAPRVVVQDIATKVSAEAIANLLRTGGLTSDDVLESWLRDVLGLPAPDPNSRRALPAQQSQEARNG